MNCQSLFSGKNTGNKNTVLSSCHLLNLLRDWQSLKCLLMLFNLDRYKSLISSLSFSECMFCDLLGTVPA